MELSNSTKTNWYQELNVNSLIRVAIVNMKIVIQNVKIHVHMQKL
jgi:hypothetical protein